MATADLTNVQNFDYGVEKILKFNQTQEYLFVNLIEELQIQTNDNKETSESN